MSRSVARRSGAVTIPQIEGAALKYNIQSGALQDKENIVVEE